MYFIYGTQNKATRKEKKKKEEEKLIINTSLSSFALSGVVCKFCYY